MMTWDLAHRLITERGLTPISKTYESTTLQELCEDYETCRKRMAEIAEFISKTAEKERRR